jgi:uncharacterized protein YgiM (DUF1202 family)
MEKNSENIDVYDVINRKDDTIKHMINRNRDDDKKNKIILCIVIGVLVLLLVGLCVCIFVSNEDKDNNDTINNNENEVVNGNLDEELVEDSNVGYVSCDDNTALLNVRAGAGTNYKITTRVKKNEIYTIVDEIDGWGKLKSGAGWINLKYTIKK